MLVYPGGDREVHRPSWESGRVDFADRKGYIRLALDEDVPLVPVVAIGGQETALFPLPGRVAGQVLDVGQVVRVEGLADLAGAAVGLNVGDMLGHILLPSKIVVEVLPPIRLREEFGDDPDVDEIHAHVTTLMQDTLDALASRATPSVIG